MVETRYQVSGVGPTLNGYNGEGDRYYTDGEIWLAVLVAGGQKRVQPPNELDSPPLVLAKDAAWSTVAGLVAK
jgi:hypothetical protein